MNEYIWYFAAERLKQEASAISASFYQMYCGIFVYWNIYKVSVIIKHKL